MAHRYDVSLKTLFRQAGNGIIRRRLFGSPVVEHLATEQPQVSNLRADMVVRTGDGSLRHVEFQTSNEAGYGLRMLGYYWYLVNTCGEHVVQTVLYLGREPLRLESGYRTPALDFRFEILNVREFEAEELLASDDWADVALALLAKGDREKALAAAMARLRAMDREECGWASATLLLLSGILGIEATVNERMREAGVIDLMENKVLAPLILREYEKGRDEGMQSMLLQLLTEKFGELPVWATELLRAASDKDLLRWSKQVLRAESLEDSLQ
jgi:hypothetical protein